MTKGYTCDMMSYGHAMTIHSTWGNQMPKPKMTDNLQPGPGRGAHNIRRFNQNLAIVAREAVPATIMMEYLLAIMEGHGNATLKRDERFEGGWCVAWPEKGEIQATAEQKQWAWTQWRQAGYGMPVQAIALEAELRTTYAQVVTVDQRELEAAGPELLLRIRQAFALTTGSPSANAPASISEPSSEAGNEQAIDAEFTEVAASAALQIVKDPAPE